MISTSDSVLNISTPKQTLSTATIDTIASTSAAGQNETTSPKKEDITSMGCHNKPLNVEDILGFIGENLLKGSGNSIDIFNLLDSK